MQCCAIEGEAHLRLVLITSNLELHDLFREFPVAVVDQLAAGIEPPMAGAVCVLEEMSVERKSGKRGPAYPWTWRSWASGEQSWWKVTCTQSEIEGLVF